MSSELASRAEFILREQRELYQYWRACAQARPIPLLNDIDPVKSIPNLLPGLSLIDVGKDFDSLKYRLAGTRVRDIYGAEITGRAVFDIGFHHKRDYWRSVYRQILDMRIPMQGAVRGPAQGREHIVLVWLRLPLSGAAGSVERILGHDASIPVSVANVIQGPAALSDNYGQHAAGRRKALP
ncbi:MAG TPA: PAS domain-containing protein [Hyphomicrobiales bacterium]|nr:PAS domain-containing protein [Hyphomicrobiales bacterium]